MLPESVLLSTACCPPVFYFSRILLSAGTYLEQHEHFIKQTFRNRYTIFSPNGPVNLIIPVEHGRKQELKIRDVQIAYYTEWQRNHWRSICTAYNSSPWFQFYKDDLQPFYERKWQFLFDYNQAYLLTILSILGIHKEIRLTDNFEQVSGPCENYREIISPKKNFLQWSPDYVHQSYTQVFSEKFPFVAGLSILDLLFNEGPAAISKI